MQKMNKNPARDSRDHRDVARDGISERELIIAESAYNGLVSTSSWKSTN